MPKIMILECKQEVSTFNPHLSQYADFDVGVGADILAFHRGSPTEVGGALTVFDARVDIELVPVYSARSITSGGTLSADGFNQIVHDFRGALADCPVVDAVYFALHGAMCAENESDPEGFLLAEARKVVGDDIPMVMSMDLHGIQTEKMVRLTNGFTAFHTYPHVDFYETGVRAAALLLRILDDGVKPIVARVPIPTLVRGDELITATGVFGEAFRAAQALTASGEVLTAGMFIGNPFTDVPELQSYSYVITDNDPETASKYALDMAAAFWKNRARMQADLISVDEAMQMVTDTQAGTIILTDAADATSSGASGDSNVLLVALVEAGYTRKTLIPLVDPRAVDAAFDVGVGEFVETPVGGYFDSRFTPLAIRARVKLLSDGVFINESHGTLWHGGRSAVLEFANHTLVITTRAVSLYDRSLFLAHGQNPQDFDVVVVKSPHCQPQFFDDWSVHNLNVDAAGSTSANLQSLGHTVCPRPMYPLDGDFDYVPDVQLFI